MITKEHTIEIAFEFLFRASNTTKKNVGTIWAEDYAEAFDIFESRTRNFENVELRKVFADEVQILGK